MDKRSKEHHSSKEPLQVTIQAIMTLGKASSLMNLTQRRINKQKSMKLSSCKTSRKRVLINKTQTTTNKTQIKLNFPVAQTRH